MAATQAPFYTINNFAGNGVGGYSGDNGPATSASIHTPYGTCLSSSGDVFIVDTANNAIRKVTQSTGIITTLTTAVKVPMSCSVNSNGDVFVSNQTHVAKVAASDKSVSFVISNDLVFFVVTYNNDLYYSDGRALVRKLASGASVPTIVAGNGTAGFGGDGGLATNAMLNFASGLFVASNGDLYISGKL